MTDFKRFCVDCDRSLKEAMQQLDKTAKKILFVVADNKLLAAITDGDLRRFLLAGGTMDHKVYDAANKKPYYVNNRDEALINIANSHFTAIPVVNNTGEIVDIVFENDKDKHIYPKLNLPVVIMAGGKGTRLEPYTKILPKPLIPVGDLPVIEHIMQQFTNYGCNDFHLIVNYKKQLIKAYFSESNTKYETFWYDEDMPLGTGGGLSLTKDSLNSTFFLTNCDVLIMADYDDILNFHMKNKNSITMVCACKNMTVPYGVIETGADGEITAMKEKPKFSFQTNTGMYIVEPEVLEDIESGVPIDFPDIIEKQQKKGRKVAAYSISEKDWFDMGQLEELENMRIRIYGK